MASEWVKVASDATKIGLGAIVGGIFTIANAINAQRLKRADEVNQEQQEAIQQIVNEFDLISLTVRSRAASLIAFYEEPEDVRNLYSEMDKELAKERTPVQCVRELHSLETKLLMLSLPKVARVVAEYREAYCLLEVEEERPAHSHTRFRDFAKQLEEKRISIITGLARVAKT